MCLYDIFISHSVYGLLRVRSFEFETGISMISDKTKQVLLILKWLALVVRGQDNDKRHVIVKCQGIFCKLGCSGKDYVESFYFRVQITKDAKSVK